MAPHIDYKNWHGWAERPRLILADRHGREVNLNVVTTEMTEAHLDNEPNTYKVVIEDLAELMGRKLPTTNLQREKAPGLFEQMVADVNVGPWHNLRAICDWLEDYQPSHTALINGLRLIIQDMRWPAWQKGPMGNRVGWLWTKDPNCRAIERPAYALPHDVHKELCEGHSPGLLQSLSRLKVDSRGVAETRTGLLGGHFPMTESYHTPLFPSLWTAISSAAFAYSKAGVVYKDENTFGNPCGEVASSPLNNPEVDEYPEP